MIDSFRVKNWDNQPDHSDLKGGVFRNRTELGLPCFSSTVNLDCKWVLSSSFYLAEKKMSFSLEKEILLQDGNKFSPNIRLVTPLFSSVQSLSRVPLFATPWTTARCPSPAPGVHPNPCPLSRWCHPTISSLSSPSLPALSLSQHPGLIKWVSSPHQVAKVLAFQLQH